MSSLIESFIFIAVLSIMAIMFARYVARRRTAAPPPLVIAEDDSMMRRAVAHARREWHRLEALHRDRPRDTYVKVATEDDRQRVWMRLTALDGDELVLESVEPPDKGSDPAPTRRVAQAAAEDWQVEREDGAIEGGWTMLVLFRKAEEQWGRLPKPMAVQRDRYRDELSDEDSR